MRQKWLFCCFCIVLPFICVGQTSVKGRFWAKEKNILWTETIEVKDIDRPVLIDMWHQKLQNQAFVKLDTLTQEGVLTGLLLNPTFGCVAQASFRIDFLYEGYIVTVKSMIAVQRQPIEHLFLTKEGGFVEDVPPCFAQLDEGLATFFTIVP